MQSKEGSTPTAVLAHSADILREIAIGTDNDNNLTIEVDGHVSTIQHNTTTDKKLFEALHYKPFCKYKLVKTTHSGVRDEVYDEFFHLMERIVADLNEIEQGGAQPVQ